MSRWYQSGWYSDGTGRAKFKDGIEVYYDADKAFEYEKFYAWHNYLNNTFVLCKDKKDIGIKGRRLMKSELDNVMSSDEYRNFKLKELGI